jgi:DNA-directed RNA polymerase
MVTKEWEKQVMLEKEMQGLGKERYQSIVKRALEKTTETRTKYGQRLLMSVVERVALALREKLEEKKAGRSNIAIKKLKELDPFVVAVIALRHVIDGISERRMLQGVAIRIGQALEYEARFSAFAEQTPARYKRALEKVQKSSHFGYKAVVLRQQSTKAKVQFKDWAKTEKLHVGIFMIDLISSIGVIEKTLSRRGKKGDKCVYYIQPTEEVREWITEQNAKAPLFSPIYLPTVIPPKPYTNPWSGGYHTKFIPPVRFVKTKNKPYLEELEDRWDEMKEVADCVNTLQNVPWKINKAVLEVMETVWDKGLTVAGVSARDDHPLPLCPVCFQAVTEEERVSSSHKCFESNPEALREWKIMATEVYEMNAKLWSHRFRLQMILHVANKFKDEEAIYFPKQLDFRGRIYDLPLYLNTQGCDFSKGLLMFAEGKPVNTPVAEKWFMIHGANVFGEDKVNFEARVQWVLSHEAQIMKVAEEPMAYLWWTEADKPWAFLAWCFEYAEYRKAQAEGREFLSHIPIAQDGTCNGLQHFSAMLRDEVGAYATNLMPTEIPQDIYRLVADRVIEILESIPEDSEDYEKAQKWLVYGIDRSLTKRPVMILPYGGTMFSCRTYIEEHVEKMAQKGSKERPYDLQTKQNMLNFLTKIVWDAIGDIVVSARQAMDWLQRVARLAGQEELPITWTTPTGFPVQQAYPDFEHRKIKTKMGESYVYLTVREEKDRLDINKQVTGVSPNFVHSLDASALVKTINLACKRGVKNFAVIHDSYATHACDSQLLADTLREAFVDMYTKHDPIEEFRKSIQAMLSHERRSKLPKTPEKGNFDITQVLKSPFFFA